MILTKHFGQPAFASIVQHVKILGKVHKDSVQVHLVLSAFLVLFASFACLLLYGL